jgi:hypothetical protein
MHPQFWLENLKGRDHLKDLDVNGRVVFKWILENSVDRCGLHLSGLGYGLVVGCAHCYEPFVSIKCTGLLDCFCTLLDSQKDCSVK